MDGRWNPPRSRRRTRPPVTRVCYDTAMAEATLREIRDFLAQKRLAVAGASRNPRDFNAGLFRNLRKRGYDLVPVNPHATEIEGQRCYARVQDIDPPVDGVLILTRAEMTEGVVKDCAAAGVKRVWMYRATGQGSVSRAAVEFCKASGITVVDGFCPYMFLPGGFVPHGIHRVILKIAGGYPAA
jgi:predicted CoA-binding protein